RGERRMDKARDRNIVETGERNVLRYANARLGEREQAADRHGVVGREDGIGPCAPRGERLSRAIARLLAEIAVDHHRTAGAEPGAIAAQALLRLEVVSRAADVRDAAVAARCQMTGHGARAAEVIDQVCRPRTARDARIHQYRREPGRQRLPEAPAPDMR